MSDRAFGLLVAGVLTAACYFFLSLFVPGLDDAQKAFEHRDVNWPTPADFDSWRASGSLKCRDYGKLRICEAKWPLFSPYDGRPIGKDRVAFACSISECAWVDP